jgi:tRNA-binding EMAP/Myf-like protein
MVLKGGNAQCDKCKSKEAYSILDETGKGICVGRVKEPKPHPSDHYSICFVQNKTEKAHYGVSRAELQMVCAASNFLLLLEEIGKWK